MDCRLTDADGRLLLLLARAAVNEYVSSQHRLDVRSYVMLKRLETPRATFVTIRRGDALRGCIGHTRHANPLPMSVRDSAISAAVQDPRFPPVGLDEVASLRYEVSVLGDGESADSPYRRVGSLEEIQIGRDGLYLQLDGASGLLLPQVAAEHGWDPLTFVVALCAKAGLDGQAWRAPGAQLYRFTAQVFS